MKNNETVLEQVVAQLADLNRKVGSIIAIMQKPEHKVLKIMDIVGKGMEILAILTIIDIIRNWIIGG